MGPDEVLGRNQSSKQVATRNAKHHKRSLCEFLCFLWPIKMSTRHADGQFRPGSYVVVVAIPLDEASNAVLD